MKGLGEALGRDSLEEEGLLYLLAFLNSSIFNKILDEKISKKRGGYPSVDENLLLKLKIPIPTVENKDLIELLQLCKKIVYESAMEPDEKRVDELVKAIYKSKMALS